MSKKMYTPQAPTYNLLDHPDTYSLDTEARRILDTYSNRNIFEPHQGR